MSPNTLHIVGFGSQGAAWADCLRKSGWNVQLYVSQYQGTTYKKALQADFNPKLITELPEQLLQASEDEKEIPLPKKTSHWIAFLCPDAAIGGIYRDHLSHLQLPLRMVLAHGFCVYTKDLQPARPEHQPVLLAPKAIGPQLSHHFFTEFPNTHTLAAAVFLPAEISDERLMLNALTRGLGFAETSLIPATFQQETVGDLISEQGLLCGTVFNFMEWTIEAMQEAGIPPALIREECLSELELIAGLVRKRGPASAFQAISEAAQCGTVAMRNRFEDVKLKAEFKKQVQTVLDGRFSSFFQSQEWRTQAKDLVQRLSKWQELLK